MIPKIEGFNEYEVCLLEVMKDLMKYVPDKDALIFRHYTNESGKKNGWYAFKKINDSISEITEDNYDVAPIASDETIKKYDVNIFKCFKEFFGEIIVT